jgi:hypothetical protein
MNRVIITCAVYPEGKRHHEAAQVLPGHLVEVDSVHGAVRADERGRVHVTYRSQAIRMISASSRGR